MLRRFIARECSHKDCVLCRQDRGIWRSTFNRRFVVCDDCFPRAFNKPDLEQTYDPQYEKSKNMFAS